LGDARFAMNQMVMMMAMNNQNGTNEDATFMESSTDFLSSYTCALLFSLCSNRHEKQP
jgi:hypothetical protein